MSLPRKIVYDLGRDQFGRKLELVEERDAFTLVREAANQRDDVVRLELTPLQLAAIAEVAREPS